MHRAYPECLLSLRYETPHLLHVTWVSPAKPEDFRAAILQALCDNARCKTSYKKYWVAQDLRCHICVFNSFVQWCQGGVEMSNVHEHVPFLVFFILKP